MRARGVAEDKVMTILEETNQPWEDITYDWYDKSIEIYCSSFPTNFEIIAIKMFEQGFQKCWVHPHVNVRRG